MDLLTLSHKTSLESLEHKKNPAVVSLLFLLVVLAQASFSQSSDAMNKVTTSVQRELSSCPIMKNSDNTNFRCPSISETRLSGAQYSLDLLGAAIFHSATARSSSRDTSAH